MVNSEKPQPGNGRRVDDADPSGQEFHGEDSMAVSSGGAEASMSANQSVARRLTEILVENGDGDLLLQSSDRGDDGVLRWIRALDMQVMGACRTDERLKPMLKLNASAGVADDRLLGHLNQHFEPSEVGVLARCLCIPLVSFRVGKIEKQGTLLSPTSERGNLCLTLLPTSDLRISFNGDDGSLEKIATFSTEARCTDIKIETISSDKTGRSFLIWVSECVVSYFWCCEKSMLLGNELLGKMKGLVMRKPSLAELSGISDSRLNCFAAHLRAFLAGSMPSSAQSSGNLLAALPDHSVDPSEHFSRSPSNFQKTARSRPYGSQGLKTNLIHQGSLSPRSCSFKDGLQRNLLSIRCAAREKLRRRGENFVSCIDNRSSDSLNGYDLSGSNLCQKDNLPKVNSSLSLAAFNFLDVLGKSSGLPFMGQHTQVPSSGPSSFSPHYCWCPPVGSALPYTLGNTPLPIAASTESASLPPLPSLLPSGGPSVLLTSKPLLNLAEIPPVGFPDLPPEPLVRLPASQHIPTFTPLICDPIIHIPVIGVCSSGQGYLVSTGASMATPIPPLISTLGVPNAERGARETLSMLISSTSSSVLPSVLNSSSNRDNILVTGSTMGLVFLSDKPITGSKDSIEQREMPTPSCSGTSTKGSSSSRSFDEGID